VDRYGNDKSGVIYRLGTVHFTEPWTNPALRGTVSVKRSSFSNKVGKESPTAGRVESWIGRLPTNTRTDNIAGSWFEVDFGTNAVKPTSYLLRSSYGSFYVPTK
jgi:hypothetical protein